MWFHDQIYAPSRYSLQKNEIHVQRTLTLTPSPRPEQPTHNDEVVEPPYKLETYTIGAVESDSAVPNAASRNSLPSQQHIIVSDSENNTSHRNANNSKVKWVFSPEKALQRFKNSRQNPRGTTYVL